MLKGKAKRREERRVLGTEEPQTKLEESRRGAREAREEAISTIERLIEERRHLIPEAVAGEETAYERLVELERLVHEARVRQELAESALQELERREQQERERVAEERQRELEARFDELVGDARSCLGRSRRPSTF